MDRRTFIASAGAMLFAAARPARAQSPGKVSRLGYLVLIPIVEPPSPERAAFLDALRELGYVTGVNLDIVYRSANNDTDRLPSLADDLVRAKVDAIVVTSSDAAFPAVNASSTVPIVMLGVGDPVAVGLVKNLARPGLNVTGISWNTIDLSGKRFGLVKEMLPRATRVAFLSNPDAVTAQANTSAARAAARQTGIDLDELPVTTADDLTRAFDALKRARPDALYVSIDARTGPYRQIIADEALRLRIPSMSNYRGYVEAGGLFSYDANLVEIYRRGASYVDRIFKGARPGDLAIELPSRYELVINLRTAKALDLTIPHALLLRADEVIQ